MERMGGDSLLRDHPVHFAYNIARLVDDFYVLAVFNFVFYLLLFLIIMR